MHATSMSDCGRTHVTSFISADKSALSQNKELMCYDKTMRHTIFGAKCLYYTNFKTLALNCSKKNSKM